MSKIEVILVRNVVGLGAETDPVRVAAGYARNYLIPNGLAIPQTGANKRRLEVLRQRRAERETHELNAMTELGKSLSKVTLTITVKTGDDGKMFGSVTAGAIADALKVQMDVALDKRKIHLEKPIHTLGEHEAELRLHADVRSTLKLVIKSSNPLPEPAVVDKKEAVRTEKRGRRPVEAAEVAEAPKGARESKGKQAEAPKEAAEAKGGKPARKQA